MANEVKIVLTVLDKASAGIKSATKGIIGGFTELMSAVGLVEKGARAVGQVIEETVGTAVDYNKQIREMSQVTGLGAEEISRIVQVADDWGISIEQLRTGLGYMNKQGITPSIETLAQLADEYVNSADKSKFAEKAARLLGRGYQTLIPLFAKGGDALRAQTKAVNDNLIATEATIKQAREYEVAVDNITDAIMAQKIAIGNELLPIITGMLTPATTEVINGQAFLVKTIGDTTQAWIREGNVLKEATIDYNNAKAAIEGVDKAARMEIATAPIEALGEAADITAGKLDNIVVKLGDVSKSALAQKALEAVNQEFQKTGDVDAYRKNIAEIGVLFSDVIPAGELEANLALVNLERAYASGDLALEPYLNNLANFDSLLRNLPKFTDIYVRTHYSSTGTSPTGGNPRQGGGPVQANTPYLVGERGAEVFVPGTAGKIVPNDQLGGSGGIYMENNIVISGLSSEEVGKLIRRELSGRLREAVAYAMAGGGVQGM